MVKEEKLTLRTRHINCFYCIAVSFLILAIVLFALSSQQSQALGNQQNRTPVIISASIILILAIIIFIWVTFYAVRYFRAKKQRALQYLKKPGNEPATERTTTTPVIVFNNAAFTNDDPIAIDRPNHRPTTSV
ncbi:unnamed protein product [Adineta ricciae]|uniref:Uncharacterized protein n=1 Tax=Adineta ricciae TaxID=249248 RepID=A0A815GQU5_ADIRI|nr:unnamed protein product [Adineta ricciae]CAF1414221.1 unnamed protein product [Adineta ricciae]